MTEYLSFLEKVYSVYDEIKFREKKFTHTDITNYTLEYINDKKLNLKLGGYGCFRIAMYLMPEAAQELGWIFLVLTGISVVYGAFSACVQTDLKLSLIHISFTPTLSIDLGILLDPISVMMLIVISTVSFMVHLYSFGYMKGEQIGRAHV